MEDINKRPEDIFEGGRYYDTIKNAILVRVNGIWVEEQWAETAIMEKGRRKWYHFWKREKGRK